MTRIIFNADDLGYSEAVTLGIIKAHTYGLIKSTTMMVNMEASPMSANLAKKYPDLYVGLHVNIVIGKPCCHSSKIPSLVNEKGFFNTKERIKNKIPLNKEEIKLEVRAQVEKFKELMGYYPTHIEGHAIRDSGLFYGIKEIAKELNLHFTDIEIDNSGKIINVGKNNHGYELPEYPDVMYYDKTADIEYWLKDLGNILNKNLVEMHTHPGYIDQFLLDNSSYNIPRAKETEIACSKELKKWVQNNNVELITFEDIRKI